MYNLTMFNHVSDILALTGLPTEEALWDAGFDLDDWDVGFCSEAPLDRVEPVDLDSIPDDFGLTNFDDTVRVPFEDSDWLTCRMADYCVGYKCVEYGDKYYYLVYHS